MSYIDRSNIESLIANIQCCLGSKGYERTRQIEKGCAIGPCDSLSYQIRLFHVLSAWYPEGYQIQSQYGPYYAFDTAGMTFPFFYTIIAPDGRGGNIILYNATAAAASNIVSFINSFTTTTGFSARIISGHLWIYAPYGYEGIKLTGNFVAIQQGAGRLYTIYGFQGQQTGIVAGAPCIDNEQVERALEVFKAACNLCAPAQTFGAVHPLIN